jgi:hypothetical protein
MDTWPYGYIVQQIAVTLAKMVSTQARPDNNRVTATCCTCPHNVALKFNILVGGICTMGRIVIAAVTIVTQAI